MKHLPNILTLSNLFCGSLASILMIESSNNLPIALILICLSLVFDFFDGFAARMTGASGELGKQLDSLADMISFGFFPGILMVSMLKEPFLHMLAPNYDELKAIMAANIFAYLGLLITLFSALRLAKFNIDEEQAYYFKGLPTPANTIFIFSLLYIQKNYEFELLNNQWFLLFITFSFSYILVANIPLLALKFKNFKWKDNSLVFSFLLVCIVLILLLKVLAIPLIIIFYIIISIIFRKKIILNGTKTS